MADLDLTDLFTALRESWYPLSEAEANDHFTPGGHAFFAFLLSHELVRNGWVPMTAPAAEPAPQRKSAEPPAALKPKPKPKAKTETEAAQP